VAPPDHEFDQKTAKMRGFTLHRKRDVAAKAAVAAQNQILWTGCKSNQTSADAYFNNRYNGAFTYYFVKVTRDTQNKLARKDVIAEMRKQMKGQFAQVPQLEGNASNRAQVIVY
jgi:hypothetical protein